MNDSSEEIKGSQKYKKSSAYLTMYNVKELKVPFPSGTSDASTFSTFSNGLQYRVITRHI